MTNDSLIDLIKSKVAAKALSNRVEPNGFRWLAEDEVYDIIRQHTRGTENSTGAQETGASRTEQPVEWSGTDDFCLRRDFEEWALLPPRLNIDKDGDGEYEDSQTRWMHKCFEVGYRKGMWGAARHINDNISNDLVKAEARIESLLKRESGTQE